MKSTQDLVAALRRAREAEMKLAAIAEIPDREWDVNDADSAEARSARAYNFALAQVRAILEVTP